MYLMGFDVGGTKIESTLFRLEKEASLAKSTESFVCSHPVSGHLHGQVLAKLREPTERHKGYQAIVEKMVGLISSTLTTAGVDIKQLNGIGFGLPGSIDPKTFRMLNGNTMVLVNQDLLGDVRAKANLPASI
ncbi:MAG: hypothetical protein RI953_1364, partial [Pseudomonadota bacterium]